MSSKVDITMPPGFHTTAEQMRDQALSLKGYSDYLRSIEPEILSPEETILCGAGDSFACAVFFERLTNFRAWAFDPYDLLLHPEVAKNRKVCFISVSGRTKTNVDAAKLVKRRASSIMAITANPESELAKTCSKVIELRFQKGKEPTPGTVSFTTSLLACATLLLQRRGRLAKIQEQIERARIWGKSASRAEGAFHFVGSGPFYGIAIYGAAKIYEFSGGFASCQLTEEFSHMNLFSLRKDDRTLILSNEKDQRAEYLFSNLSHSGLNCDILRPNRPRRMSLDDALETAISYSIRLQYLSLHVALNRGLKRPSFLNRKDLLDISNKMIY